MNGTARLRFYAVFYLMTSRKLRAVTFVLIGPQGCVSTYSFLTDDVTKIESSDIFLIGPQGSAFTNSFLTDDVTKMEYRHLVF